MPNVKAAARIAPKFTLSDKPNEDFNFYLQFVLPLVPKLPDDEERKLAAEWIEKLVEDKSNHKLRAEYLLLLLFALQRRHLSGPFTSYPSSTETLQPFENNLDMFGMMEQMVKRKSNPKVIPPYYSEVSGDYKDYVVSQEILNFGVHCYMATSNDPIQKWKNSHLAHIPKESATAVPHQCQVTDNKGNHSPARTAYSEPRSLPCTPIRPRQPELRATPIPNNDGSDLDGELFKDYSVNLQALQSLIPRSSYMPNADTPSRIPQRVSSADTHRSSSPRNLQKEPTHADDGTHIRSSLNNILDVNQPVAGTSVTAQLGGSLNAWSTDQITPETPVPELSSESIETQLRNFRISQDNITNGEIEQLMAEYEQKLKSDSSNIGRNQRETNTVQGQNEQKIKPDSNIGRSQPEARTVQSPRSNIPKAPQVANKTGSRATKISSLLTPKRNRLPTKYAQAQKFKS